MSVATMREVSYFDWTNALRDAEVGLTTWAVGLMFASYCDGDTGRNIFPGDGLVAEKLGCSRTTVRTHREKLIKKGWLVVAEKYDRKRQKATALRLAIPRDHGQEVTTVAGQDHGQEVTTVGGPRPAGDHAHGQEVVMTAVSSWSPPTQGPSQGPVEVTGGADTFEATLRQERADLYARRDELRRRMRNLREGDYRGLATLRDQETPILDEIAKVENILDGLEHMPSFD